MFRLKLKELLIEKEISVYRLEKETGISHKALYDLVNSKTKGITFENMYKICDYLNCSPGDLFERVN